MELEASPDPASEGTQPHFCHRLLAPVSPEHALNLPNMGGRVSIPHSALRNVGGCSSPSDSPTPNCAPNVRGDTCSNSSEASQLLGLFPGPSAH